jgi:hypothetical protein
MRRHRLHAARIAILGLWLCASVARAVDGVIEINDASIVAAGGYPAVIGTTASYVLTGNLTPPAGADAIVVLVNNVTIDLNGFTIDGAGAGVNGIFAPFVLGLTVRNGTVTGFTGPGISPGASSKLFQLKITSNGGGIAGASGCLIVENVIDSNLGIGIDAGRCKIENNVIVGNTTGISGSTNVVVHNQINSNGAGGILTPGGGDTIQENVLLGNTTFGIADGVFGPPPPFPPPAPPRVNVTGNTIEGNFGPGVSLAMPALVADNTVSGNFATGISCGSGCVVRDNTVTQNNLGGAPASGGVVVGAGANVTGNGISFNTGFGLTLPLVSGYSQNTFMANGPLDVVSGGPHPTSGFMNLCSGIPGPAPTCP